MTEQPNLQCDTMQSGPLLYLPLSIEQAEYLADWLRFSGETEAKALETRVNLLLGNRLLTVVSQ